MRVAFINSERGWRGGEEHLRLLLTGLPTGFEPLVIAQPGSPLAQRLAGSGIAVQEIAQGGGLDAGAVLRLRGALRRFAPAVVVATTSRAHGLALPATLGTGQPLVVTRHLDFPISRWSRWKYRLAERVIAVSRRVGEVLAAGGVAAERITVVRNGIDPAPYALTRRGHLRAALGIPADASVILSVGALTPQKDHPSLFAAFSRLAAERPSLWLAVVGTGEHDGELRALAARCGHGRIAFAGFRDDLPELLADGDLLALTSRNEGLPLAILEAQAAGLATVATDAGGTRDVVDATCGRLVPVGDVTAITAALAELLADPDLRRQLGTAARAKAVAYDHRTMAAGHAAVWAAVAQGSAR